MKKIFVKRRHPIRRGEAQNLMARLQKEIGDSATLFATDLIEIIETDAEVALYLIKKKPLIMDTGEWVFPTLRGAVQSPFRERQVVVDKGAIPYIVNGADVMRPGIVSVTEDVVAGRPVQIVDETHKKPLAIALAQMSGEEMMRATSGKMCRSVHHIGDEIWTLEL